LAFRPGRAGMWDIEAHGGVVGTEDGAGEMPGAIQTMAGDTARMHGHRTHDMRTDHTTVDGIAGVGTTAGTMVGTAMGMEDTGVITITEDAIPVDAPHQVSRATAP